MIGSLKDKWLSKADLAKKLEHIMKKKSYFWGKDEVIYHFYHSQEILIRDLICNHEKVR